MDSHDKPVKKQDTQHLWCKLGKGIAIINKQCPKCNKPHAITIPLDDLGMESTENKPCIRCMTNEEQKQYKQSVRQLLGL
jgi:hypothetical protein